MYVKVELFEVLAYLLSDGVMKVYKMYTASGMSTDDHVFHATSPVVIKALIQHFLT